MIRSDRMLYRHELRYWLLRVAYRQEDAEASTRLTQEYRPRSSHSLKAASWESSRSRLWKLRKHCLSLTALLHLWKNRNFLLHTFFENMDSGMSSKSLPRSRKTKLL